jgi:4-oxalocrotonate tautomerase
MMPYIHIHWIEGRSKDQKERIVRKFTDTMVQVAGVEPDMVHFIFHDHSMDDFAYDGKLLGRIMESVETIET